MQKILKIGFTTLALVLGANALRPATAQASGFLMSSGLDGQPICMPGGVDDCASTKPVLPSWPGDQG